MYKRQGYGGQSLTYDTGSGTTSITGLHDYIVGLNETIDYGGTSSTGHGGLEYWSTAGFNSGLNNRQNQEIYYFVKAIVDSTNTYSNGVLSLSSWGTKSRWAFNSGTYNNGSYAPTQYSYDGEKNINVSAPDDYEIILETTEQYSSPLIFNTGFKSINNLHDYLVFTLPSSSSTLGVGNLRYLSLIHI